MGMRIAGAHRGAAIFKDLHVIDLRHRSQFLELLSPGADHTFDVLCRHSGKGEVVAGRKADHAAESGLAFGDNQAPVFQVQAVVANARFECGKVVVEDECARIFGINDTANPGISRTEVTRGVVLRFLLCRNPLELALPGTAGAMRRDEHPLVGERIQSAMWIFGQLQSIGSNCWVTIYAQAPKHYQNVDLTVSGRRPIVATGCNRLHMHCFIASSLFSRRYWFPTSASSGILE